jgi:hypothetical protein
MNEPTKTETKLPSLESLKEAVARFDSKQREVMNSLQATPQEAIREPAIRLVDFEALALEQKKKGEEARDLKAWDVMLGSSIRMKLFVQLHNEWADYCSKRLDDWLAGKASAFKQEGWNANSAGDTTGAALAVSRMVAIQNLIDERANE